MKVFGLLLILLMSVGCGRISNDPIVSDQISNIDNPNQDNRNDVGITTPSGPVNLDPNIKSMQMGDTTYSVIYTDPFFYPEQKRELIQISMWIRSMNHNSPLMRPSRL